MTVFIQIKLPKDMHFMKSLEGTVVCNSYKKNSQEQNAQRRDFIKVIYSTVKGRG